MVMMFPTRPKKQVVRVATPDTQYTNTYKWKYKTNSNAVDKLGLFLGKGHKVTNTTTALYDMIELKHFSYKFTFDEIVYFNSHKN